MPCSRGSVLSQYALQQGGWSGVVCSGGAWSGGGSAPVGHAWSRGLALGVGGSALGGAWWRPSPQTATAVVGTHPTGMHSCPFCVASL